VFGWSGSQDTGSGEGWADVRHVIEYQSEVSAGDLLEIRACIVKVGTTSITIRYEMFNSVRNELAATLECVCVLFDLKNRKAKPLSDGQRKQAEQHMSNN